MAELFKTNPEKLNNLLDEVSSGDIQLPDFQRGWVWDETRIKNLLISVASRFPIGAVMMLDAKGENAKFSSVPLHNTNGVNHNPGRLLLDGQQRLTSLYQTLKHKGATETTSEKNKKKTLKRHYYFSILEMIKDEPDEETLIFIANEKKMSRQTGTINAYDVSTVDKECEHWRRSP